MDNNITIKEETFAEDSKKYEIVLIKDSKEEKYFLDKEPDAQSALVLTTKQEILHDMSLESVLINLERAGDLMFVAYLGVAGAKGGQLQAKISGLEKTLADLCSECVLAMQLFQTESGEVMGYLIKTFSWLLKGEEKVALKQLTRCEGSAKKMADKAEELAKRFDEIAKTTEQVLEDTQIEQGTQNEKKLEIQKKLRDMEAEQKKTDKLQKDLAIAAKEAQQRYDEAKESENTEKTRAFILGITSAVTSAVGSGVGVYAAMSNPAVPIAATLARTQAGGVNQQAKADQDAVIEEAKKKADAVKAEAEKAKQEAEKSKAEAEKAKQEAEKSKAEAEKAKQEAEKSKEPKAKEEAEEKRQQAEKAQQDAETARKKAEETKARADAALAGLKDFSDKMDKMRESSTKAAESSRSEKLQYLNQKLELEKQNREALALLVEYAEKIKNSSVDQRIAESAIDSLQQAIWALKKIVTSLSNASLFWRSMEQYCKNLSQSKFKEMIDDVQDLTLEKKLKEYLSAGFMRTAVEYICRWKALQVICTEYLEAANKARNKVLANIEAAPTIEEAQKLAPIVAKEMVDKVMVNIKEAEKREKSMEAEKKQLQPTSA